MESMRRAACRLGDHLTAEGVAERVRIRQAGCIHPCEQGFRKFWHGKDVPWLVTFAEARQIDRVNRECFLKTLGRWRHVPAAHNEPRQKDESRFAPAVVVSHARMHSQVRLRAATPCRVRTDDRVPLVDQPARRAIGREIRFH